MADVQRITVDDLKKRMDAGEQFTLIDVRNPQAWAESDAKMPGALRIPLDELEQHRAEIRKDRPIVTYCT